MGNQVSKKWIWVPLNHNWDKLLLNRNAPLLWWEGESKNINKQINNRVFHMILRSNYQFFQRSTFVCLLQVRPDTKNMIISKEYTQPFQRNMVNFLLFSTRKNKDLNMEVHFLPCDLRTPIRVIGKKIPLAVLLNKYNEFITSTTSR